MTELYKKLKEFGTVKLNEPLSKHTTFKIGGKAEFFVIAEQTDQLVQLLKFLDEEGIERFILGGGSNMLVRDEDRPGVVIQIKTKDSQVTDTGIIADAGCSTVATANLSMKEGFVGFEWGVGIPGTMGGAVRGNAGAMGWEMQNNVEGVDAYIDGEVVYLSNADCDFHYRHSIFKENGGVVLRVHLKLEKSESKDGMKKALEYLQYRSKTQPQGYASTGCIFKNFEIKNPESLQFDLPEEFHQKRKISAGWLIEKSGMKNAQVGKAKVSETHGNFVVNMGSATATEVLTLIEQIKEKVYDTFGIEIEEEIQIV